MGMGMHITAIIICVIVIIIAYCGLVAARALLLMVVHRLGQARCLSTSLVDTIEF